MKWLLIFVWVHSPGVTVTQEAKFADRPACIAAGNAWIEQVEGAGREVLHSACLLDRSAK